MAASKEFLTFSQQVKHLKFVKQLDIANEKSAEELLQRIGYFSLIDGYKELFRIPFTKNINPELLLMRLLHSISLIPS